MQAQLALFEDETTARAGLVEARSGTFVDNMALPVHRWFRYSAGFSAQWVERVIKDWAIAKQQVILDPFAC